MTHESPSLRVSVVVFHPDLEWLGRTFRALTRSACAAREAGALGAVAVDLVDNGTSDEPGLDALATRLATDAPWCAVRVIRGHGNVGYGEGHNLSILPADDDVHLVLNPDVELDDDAIAEAMRYLASDPGVVLVSPDVVGVDGARQFLCRRQPSVLVLYARGFAPAWVRRRLAPILARYEMRDVVGRGQTVDVPLATGCCMFLRGSTVRAVGGFAPEYFLYFEDYDLSARLGARGALRYVPSVRIVHAGGDTARRGWTRIRLFLRSAARYFAAHGWRWV